MELRTVNGRLKPGGAFKLIATGYLLGAGAIFIPLFVLIDLILLVRGALATMNGQTVAGDAPPLVWLMQLIALPVIIAGQSVMIGGLVVFGLWLYDKRRPIRVIAEDVVD